MIQIEFMRIINNHNIKLKMMTTSKKNTYNFILICNIYIHICVCVNLFVNPQKQTSKR